MDGVGANVATRIALHCLSDGKFTRQRACKDTTIQRIGNVKNTITRTIPIWHQKVLKKASYLMPAISLGFEAWAPCMHPTDIYLVLREPVHYILNPSSLPLSPFSIHPSGPLLRAQQ